jgi:hypothetical protein
MKGIELIFISREEQFLNTFEFHTMRSRFQSYLMKFFFSFFFTVVFFSANAQEIVSELKYNSALIAASKIYHPKLRGSDTLNLPFIDDFSNAKVYPYPDPKLWTDKYVYVNTTYPVNPISIGVATFDGLDPNGMPYDTVAVYHPEMRTH